MKNDAVPRVETRKKRERDGMGRDDKETTENEWDSSNYKARKFKNKNKHKQSQD